MSFPGVQQLWAAWTGRLRNRRRCTVGCRRRCVPHRSPCKCKSRSARRDTALLAATPDVSARTLRYTRFSGDRETVLAVKTRAYRHLRRRTTCVFTGGCTESSHSAKTQLLSVAIIQNQLAIFSVLMVERMNSTTSHRFRSTVQRILDESAFLSATIFF